MSASATGASKRSTTCPSPWRRARSSSLIGANGAGKTTTMKTISGFAEPAKRLDHVRGRRHHEDEGAHPGGARHFAGAGRSGDLPGHDGHGEPRHGRIRPQGPQRHGRGLRPGVLAVSAARRAQDAAGRHDVRRRAADARDRPGAHGAAAGCCCWTSRRWGLRRSSSGRSSRSSREINEQGTTILLVEQNANQALARAHRAFVLETGTITHSGTGRELLSNPAIKEAYLGVG